MPLSDVAIVTVQASWSTNPDDTPSWETITEAESVSLTGRGRTYELDESTPATGRVRVDNTSAAYTNGATIGSATSVRGVTFGGGTFGGGPFVSTSGSAGTVTTDKRIRATVDLSPIGGTSYTLFDHVITACPTTTVGGFDYGYSEFSTVDYLDALGGRTLRSPYFEQTIYEGPTHFWTLGEAPGSDSAVDLITNTAATIESFFQPGNTTSGAAAFGGDPFYYTTDSTTNLAFSPHLTGGTPDGGEIVVVGKNGVGAFLSGSKWGFRLTFATTSTASAGYLFYQANYSGTADDPLSLFIGTSGDMALKVPGLTNYAWSGPYNDGLPHTVQVICNVGSVKLYVDGALITTLGIPSGLGTGGRCCIGGGVISNGGYLDSPYDGRIGYVAFFDSGFIDSGKSLTDHARAAVGFTGDTPDVRISRVLGDWCGYTGAGSVDASATIMGAQVCEGSTVAAEILSCARSDDGIFFIAGDGQPTFRTRAARYATATVVTLGTSSLPVDTSDLTFDYDRQLMVNDFYANRPGGPTYRFTDATSVTQHRARTPSGSLEFNVATDEELRHAAGWYLYRYSQPRARVGSVRINPYHSTALAQYAATLKPFDRIAITNLPSNAPATTMQFIVEQVSHPRLSNDEWVTELALSPWIPALTLDDATYGALDTYPLPY